MNEVLKNILTRRSIRKYTDQQVSDDDLNQIIEAGKYAPSGSNAQSWHFIVIQNKEVLSDLNKKVIQAFGNFEIKEDTFKPILYGKPASQKEGYVFYNHAPTIVVVSNEADSGNNYVDSACAIENMFLAAQSLGLGTCWINQLRWLNQDQSLKKHMISLGMPEHHMVCGAFTLGYRDGELPPAPERKENTVTFIK